MSQRVRTRCSRPCWSGASCSCQLAASSVHVWGHMQGSGWGWLGYNKDAGKLVLTTTANQDPAATQVDMLPIRLGSAGPSEIG